MSSHYLVGRDGRVAQFVDEGKRSWHAGASYWKGETDINSLSIGVELDNDGFEPFSDQLMTSLISLCGCINERHNILANMVQGHSDIAVGRKVDPSPYFSWQKLAEAGIGIFPVVEADHTILFKPGETSTAFGAVQSSLKIQGYKIEVTNTFDIQSSMVIQAFKRHFIPEAFKLEEVQGGKKDWVYVDQNWDKQADEILKQLLKESNQLEVCDS